MGIERAAVTGEEGPEPALFGTVGWRARCAFGARIEGDVPPDGAVVVTLLWGGEEVRVRRFTEGNEVGLRPENSVHEELALLAEDVRLRGGEENVAPPPGGRGA